jgi:hypothetical protein
VGLSIDKVVLQQVFLEARQFYPINYFTYTHSSLEAGIIVSFMATVTKESHSTTNNTRGAIRPIFFRYLDFKFKGNFTIFYYIRSGKWSKEG